MRLKTKFTIAFLCIALLVFAVGGLGLYTTEHINEQLQELNSSVVPSLVSLGKMKVASYDILEAIRDKGLDQTKKLNPTSSDYKSLSKQVSYHQNILFDELRVYVHRAGNTPEEHPQARELEILVQQQHTLARDLLREISTISISLNFESIWSLLQATHQRISAVVDEATKTHIVVLEEHQDFTEKALAKASFIHYSISGIVFVFAVLLAFGLAQAMVRPIEQLKKAVNKLSKGERNVQVSLASSGELSELIGAFNTLSNSLNETTITKDHMHSIIDSMPDILMVVDARGKISLANKSATLLLGYEQDELEGNFFDNIHSLGLDDINIDTISTNTEQILPSAHESAFFHKDGEEIPVLLSVSIMDNKLLDESYICVAKDLREKKQVEEEIREYRIKMQHSEQLASLGAMSALVAHKLSQPLTSMRLFLQQSLRALESKTKLDMIPGNLEDCLAEIKNVDATIRELLSFTRKPHTAAKQAVSILEVTYKTIQLLLQEANEARIQLLAENLTNMPTIQGTQEEIEELFYLLIRNAIEAAPRNRTSTLIVEAEEHDDNLSIHFVDTCGGIKEEDLEKVFDIFFTTKPRGKGTGLGLNICKQIVQNHNGNISVDSIYGNGSTFTVTLPKNSNKEHTREKV